MKKPRCHNCKHSGDQFKIGKLTYLHCQSPTYEKEFEEKGVVSPWETLRVFNYTCDEHEFK